MREASASSRCSSSMVTVIAWYESAMSVLSRPGPRTTLGASLRPSPFDSGAAAADPA